MTHLHDIGKDENKCKPLSSVPNPTPTVCLLQSLAQCIFMALDIKTFSKQSQGIFKYKFNYV